MDQGGSKCGTLLDPVEMDSKRLIVAMTISQIHVVCQDFMEINWSLDTAEGKRVKILGHFFHQI